MLKKERKQIDPEEEREEVMDMYKYKEVFSLRDEIGTYPNIEVEIDVMDRSPFFIRPYHVREAWLHQMYEKMLYLQKYPVLMVSKIFSFIILIFFDFG